MSRCRGDLAFFCSQTSIAEELTDWARSSVHGYPRSEESLEEQEFADVLMGIVEQFHLEYSTYAAFMGTEEEREETAEPRVPIDAMDGEENLFNQMDDLQGAD